MKIKKIIIFFPIFNKGGLEQVANTLLNYFKKFDIEIYFITFDKNKYLQFKNKKAKIICPKIDKINKKKISNFRKIIFCIKPFVQLLKKNNKKNCVILSLQNSAVSIVLSKIYNFKIIVKNAAPITAFFYLNNFFKSIIVFISKIVTYNFADGIIVNSQSNENSLSKFIVKRKKIRMIYNPIILNKKNTHTKRKNQILSVGRVTYEKGIHVLIEAISKIKYLKFKLIVLGEGSYLRDIKQKVLNLGLQKKIIFKNWVKKPDKYYKTSKLFVLPSLYEGFGNSLVEAMSFGVPCISTSNSGGPKEILGNGKYGYLVKKNNANELKNKIIFCIKNHNKTRKKSIIAKKSLSRFDLNICGKKYINFLNEIL